MATMAQTNPSLRQSGQQSVGNVTAKPITQIGLVSSAATTFTATTVTDAAAWNLSAVVEGDLIETSDGYKGIVTGIDIGAVILTVHHWMTPEGNHLAPNSAGQPTNTSTVTVHRNNRCKRILIKAAAGNTDAVHVRLGGSVPGSAVDFPLEAGESVTLDAEAKWLDLTTVFVLSETGTQTLTWMLGASSPGNVTVTISGSGAALNVNPGTFVDGDTTPDISGNSYWQTANTGNTSITDFDNPTASGHEITVRIGDTRTTFIHGAGTIFFPNSLDSGPHLVGDILVFLYNAAAARWEIKSSNAGL